MSEIETILATLREQDAHEQARTRRLVDGLDLALKALGEVVHAETIGEAVQIVGAALEQIAEVIREP